MERRQGHPDVELEPCCWAVQVAGAFGQDDTVLFDELTDEGDQQSILASEVSVKRLEGDPGLLYEVLCREAESLRADKHTAGREDPGLWTDG
jgi:hypothetical protein